MKRILSGFAVMAVLGVVSGCDSSTITVPTSPSVTVVPARTPAAPSNFPPLTGPGRVFVFDHQSSYPVNSYTKDSRLVLYDNGAFELQYTGIGGYPGKYTATNGVIVFEWQGWSLAGPWGATATLSGESLTMQYNLIMQLTDFEDAVYVLKPS